MRLIKEIIFICIVFWLLYVLSPWAAEAQNIPNWNLSTWQKNFKLHTMKTHRGVRCGKKKSLKKKDRCYKRLMQNKFGNSKRRYVYFINNRSTNAYYSSESCLGISPCYAWGAESLFEKVTDLAAYGIEPGESFLTQYYYKIFQYEDAYIFGRTARQWCKRRFTGTLRSQCVKGYWKILDPNKHKFPGRPEVRPFQ